LLVPAPELSKIEKNHLNDVDRQMAKVIEYWQNNTVSVDCSWVALANAVERMGKYGNLVKKLKERHSRSAGQNEVVKSKPVVNKPVPEKTAAKSR
jgi:hypothetical protein